MTATPRQAETVRVWDPIVRIGHWVIVIGFFTAYLSGDELPGIHTWAGYVVAGTVLVRVIWGLVGTRHARFSSFVTGPRGFFRYIKGLFAKKADRHLGHNPAGAAMIIALLIALTGTTVSGMALLAAEEGRGPLTGMIASQDSGATAQAGISGGDEAFGDRDEHRGDGYEEDDDDTHDGGSGETLENLHSAFTYLTLALVALHILGVIASSLMHRENLVRAMITGRKRKSD
ncbi:cytochrome b/b6 domain-containing protein [uncultured Maricaulis sp.]|uniref:cytochrome b/b6 domain-containing protein n=1 Tax=uncultured Maricaulis sp. TaxID=174710 RepID=UPI002607DE2C|nr:cytochrome b/b6 domain-containing protein [uncultured Maricaulis sp.]